MTLRWAALAMVALLALHAWVGCARGERHRPSLTLRGCRLPGLDIEAKCAELNVPEDRSRRLGQQISLHFAVVPALALRPLPDPLFLLVGGPGQSATVSGAPIAGLLRDVRTHRDIVLVDQRGTGRSGPLACPRPNGTLAQLFAEDLDADSVAACRSQLKADLSQYLTSVAMDDLDDVRAALGYERINLWGASYGTRAALEYARRHQAHTRRIVLDGPVPTEVKLPLYAGRDAQRALDLLFADCRHEAACAESFPNFEATFQRLLDALAQTPTSVTVRHPRTGQTEALRLDRDAFASAIRLLLYSPPLSALIPLIVTRAAEGDYGPLVAAVAALADSVEQDLQYGMFLSVVCAEDVPRITEREAEALTYGNFLGPSAVQSMRRACQRWPVRVPPESYFEPVVEPTPTLVLSGDLDPIVPPAWGELVAKRMPNSTHIVVRGVAHGVTQVACFPRLIAEFLDAKVPGRIETGCARAMKRPPFITSATGSPP